MGRRSYGLSESWVVGVMGRRNRALTPNRDANDQTSHTTRLISCDCVFSYDY